MICSLEHTTQRMKAEINCGSSLTSSLASAGSYKHEESILFGLRGDTNHKVSVTKVPSNTTSPSCKSSYTILLRKPGRLEMLSHDTASTHLHASSEDGASKVLFTRGTAQVSAFTLVQMPSVMLNHSIRQSRTTMGLRSAPRYIQWWISHLSRARVPRIRLVLKNYEICL